VGTAAPMDSMVFTVMAALAQMELEITRERIPGSVAERRAAGKDLGGRRPIFTDSQIRSAVRLIEAGSRPPRWPGTWGCRGPPSTAASGISRSRQAESAFAWGNLPEGWPSGEHSGLGSRPRYR
jgi:DNA invertase Pin-like site-specific DNA recombinase